MVFAIGRESMKSYSVGLNIVRFFTPHIPIFLFISVAWDIICTEWATTVDHTEAFPVFVSCNYLLLNVQKAKNTALLSK